jgi:hypothetical protein
MVDATVELLHEQMQDDAQPRNVVIACRVVERDSVRAARPSQGKRSNPGKAKVSKPA